MKEYKVTPDGKVKVSINIPLNTLKRLDEIRKQTKKTRSNWITQLILEKLSHIKN
jgi:metal-responsive CopG/Arc/MetJ family transcriptional regulator